MPHHSFTANNEQFINFSNSQIFPSFLIAHAFLCSHTRALCARARVYYLLLPIMAIMCSQGADRPFCAVILFSRPILSSIHPGFMVFFVAQISLTYQRVLLFVDYIFSRRRASSNNFDRAASAAFWRSSASRSRLFLPPSSHFLDLSPAPIIESAPPYVQSRASIYSIIRLLFNCLFTVFEIY